MAGYGRGSFDGFSSYQGGNAYSDSSGDGNKIAQTLGNNIQKITQNVNTIQRLVNQIGTPQDSNDLRENVHKTQHYTNQLAKDTSKLLKDLTHTSAPPNTDQRQWKMQKERLTEEFSNALKNFQTVQRTAAEKERASVARARASSGLNYSPFEEQTTDDQHSTPGFSQTKQMLQMEEDVDLELIKEREDAILKLEKDIMDVNQIFKDLGMLVHEQGEMLDSIEANVESAQIHVEEGTGQLAKARDYQSKARRKKCCCAVILVVVLAVVVIIIVVSVTQTNKK